MLDFQTIAAIAFLTAGVGYKNWQKKIKTEKELYAPLKKLAEITTMPKPYIVILKFEEEIQNFHKPIHWNNVYAKRIKQWVNTNWNNLTLETQERLVNALKFPASPSQKRALHSIKRSGKEEVE